LRLTTLVPREVELIVGNVYTSGPVTVNVYLVALCVVENSNATGAAVVAVYATLTVRAVGLTTALVRSAGIVVPLTLRPLRPNSSEAFVDGKLELETNANVS
jgi:hypothetical protein